MAVDPSTPRTRRAILAGALGAAAAIGIDAIGRPAPADAATSYVVLGGFNSAGDTTAIDSVQGPAIAGSSGGSGGGVLGRSGSGWGVVGQVDNDVDGATGVYGSVEQIAGTSITYGVQGRVGSTAGTGVYGKAGALNGATIGVRGDSLSNNGIGALGIASATSGFIFGVDGRSHSPSGIGTRGLAYGNGTGVLGWSGTTTPPQANAGAKTGVQGYASQDNTSVGVRGDSTTGRGGLFKGKAAQVRLSPSSAATHPSSGQKGDLFVDTSGRLWFCKGGTSWKQLA